MCLSSEHPEKLLAQTKRKDLVPRVRTVSKAEIALLASKKILADDRHMLQKERFLRREMMTPPRIRCERLTRSITQRKWDLLAQLRTIYPVTQSSDGKSLSLAGFRLPNSEYNGLYLVALK